MKFSFLRYQAASTSFRMHPLVHFWASQKLEDDPQLRLSMIICIVGLVSSCFSQQDLLPPLFARTSRHRGIEERSLGLWPWRQYPTLAPHARLCLHYANTLDNLPESVACASLALLQVLEYTTFGSLDRDQEISIKLIERLRRFQSPSDRYLQFCVALWGLSRAEICECRKYRTESLTYFNYSEGEAFPCKGPCASCISAASYAKGMENHGEETPRVRAMDRALRLVKSNYVFDNASSMTSPMTFPVY